MHIFCVVQKSGQSFDRLLFYTNIENNKPLAYPVRQWPLCRRNKFNGNLCGCIYAALCKSAERNLFVVLNAAQKRQKKWYMKLIIVLLSRDVIRFNGDSSNLHKMVLIASDSRELCCHCWSMWLKLISINWRCIKDNFYLGVRCAFSCVFVCRL